MSIPKTPRAPEASTTGRHLQAVAVTLIALSCISLYVHANDPAGTEMALLAKLRDGEHVALIRHALAPGTGDPATFELRDCTTQRNLSDEGRAQARRIGDKLRAHGIDAARVMSSQWCRCLETARLLGLGTVEELPSLNSFFEHFERRDAQTLALGRWLDGWGRTGVLLLVTHQVNISASTDTYAGSGELIVARVADRGTLEFVGRISTP